ncbi:MAG: DEAD/DEAH box helicase [Planctomycetota bacterium]|jgi:ATP-dependent Lhr-like helicase
MDLFSPPVRDWFASTFDAPTDIQDKAWPAIANGDHVLLTAPTGSGKTLTAFLWAIDRLATGAWEPGGLRVLYVSPLKALNNDIRRNLLEPLEGLGLSGKIRVAVRSGDTPQSERRQMLRRPPEILVTTPESLNLLLSSHGGRSILTGVRSVILDEIHAVAGGKRGAYLMSAVERLTDLSGEFQRVSLSATVHPLESVAQLVGGFMAPGRARPVRVVRSEASKELDVAVRTLDDTGWPPLVEEFKAIVAKNRSTLFFVNNRALSEKMVRWLNEDEDEPVAYAHHGSLSREIRALIEQRLKDGSLKAIVATSSLEMGIDIGHLDEVVLIQSPRSINSAVQRVGRAGHGVGETSRGRIYPTHARDVLDAAVLAPLIRERATETLRPVRNPLDVLAQVITAMCGVAPRGLDALYDGVRRCWSFHTLKREAFDRVIAMLNGRYADTRVRELRPRLRTDPETRTVTARDGVLPLVWRSGGVIPDRGYFSIRIQGSGARLGELDEEFVWERRIGDHFSLGAQTWRIDGITRNDVLVVPSQGTKPIAPFWKAERFERDFELCEAISRFLEDADARVDDDGFEHELRRDRGLDDNTAAALALLLRRQRRETGAPLPHRHHLVAEYLTGDTRQIVFHAGWGGRVLRPWSIAMAAAAPFHVETYANDDSLMVQVPDSVSAKELLALVTPDNVEALLRQHLEDTGFFGARFRENAQRALLLPRQRANQRLPLWLSRLRAKKLMQSVRRFGDFPVVAETWRTCLEDEFDLRRLAELLDEVRSGEIAVSEVHTTTHSPFAEGVAWRATNQYMYADDRPLEGGEAGGSLSEQALREVLHDANLRPKLDPALVAEFEAKLQGTAPGYEAGLLERVEDCLLLPDEAQELEDGVARLGAWLVPAAQRARVERALAGGPEALASCIAEFLQAQGPVTLGALRDIFGAGEAALRKALDQPTIVADRFLLGAQETEYCDAENLERLLRLTRAAARPRFEPLPKESLALFLAAHQGLVERGANIDDLRTRLEPLFGYVASAAQWERAILPVRLRPYDPAWIDQLMQESDLVWFGAGKQRTGFCFHDDVPLFLPEPQDRPALLPDQWGSYDFFDLQARTGLESADLARELWDLAWQGRARNDTFVALRKGIESDFEPRAPRKRRRGIGAWASSRPMVGRWKAIDRPGPGDRLAQAEDDKDRARQLLARYGVLCRELCAHELPDLRWGRLAKALRILELSGEALAGQFFAGIDGLQFASHEAFRALRRGLDVDAVYFVNAADPASLCGTGLVPDLPPRLASTWLVYSGNILVLVARRNGRDLEWRAEPDAGHLAFFAELGERIEVETIDGAPAPSSPHAALLESVGFSRDYKSLNLERAWS